MPTGRLLLVVVRRHDIGRRHQVVNQPRVVGSDVTGIHLHLELPVAVDFSPVHMIEPLALGAVFNISGLVGVRVTGPILGLGRILAVLPVVLLQTHFDVLNACQAPRPRGSLTNERVKLEDNPGQNPDDHHNHQKLNQCKTPAIPLLSHSVLLHLHIAAVAQTMPPGHRFIQRSRAETPRRETLFSSPSLRLCVFARESLSSCLSCLSMLSLLPSHQADIVPMIEMSGTNMAITMTPMIRASTMIMIGSITDVRPSTAVSTSSS